MGLELVGAQVDRFGTEYRRRLVRSQRGRGVRRVRRRVSEALQVPAIVRLPPLHPLGVIAPIIVGTVQTIVAGAADGFEMPCRRQSAVCVGFVMHGRGATL
jgi:hypothetical protein